MCTTGTDFVSLAEAAVVLKTTEPRILMMLKQHQLLGRQDGSEWRIDKASLAVCGTLGPGGFTMAGCGGGCGGCGGH